MEAVETPSIETQETASHFPPQYTVLGVRLLPLSTGRYRTLRMVGSPFVSEEAGEATLEDLFCAVAICGMTCREFNDHLCAGTLKKPLRKWGKRLRRQLRKEKGFTSHSRAAMFQQYVKEYQRLPFVPLPVQNGQDPSSRHWSDSLETVLRSKLNWDTEMVEEVPLTKALEDFFGVMEMEGSVRLVSHERYVAMGDEGRANASAIAQTLKLLGKEDEDGEGS